MQHGQPAFHRSVSQPVDMDLSGLASFPAVSGWKPAAAAAGENSSANPSAMWRPANAAVAAGQQHCCRRFISILHFPFLVNIASIVYGVVQNKLDYSTFQPSLRKFA